MNRTNIYAIIVTYNAMQWIDRCLGSVRASTIPLVPVVVDNHSADETVDHIRSCFPEAVIMSQIRNLGFGQANNIGIRYAMEHHCSHVLLLNQDAWIDADMIATLLTYDDGKSLLSPIHKTGDGDAFDFNFEHHAMMRSPYYSRYLSDVSAGRIGRYYTDEINAACWLLPRQILAEIGGFNPLFFHYAEDNDYLQRLHYFKKGTYFVSTTYCYHDRANVPVKPPTRQSIYQQLVLRAVDINHNKWMCMLHRCRYGLAVWHTAFAERRPQDIGYYFQALWSFCQKRGEIMQNRKIIQQTGSHWLT